MPLGDIASSVVEQLAAVDAALRSGPDLLRLAGVSLRLHGSTTVVDETLAMEFTSPAAGSEVALTFGTPPGASAMAVPVVVPDVRGYTAALARRKIEAAMLNMAIAPNAGPLGKVSETSPRAGLAVLSGTTVRVIVR